MNEIEAFKADIEAHLSGHKMTPTDFGKMFAGDPRFVFQLREGREPRTATRQKVMDAMSASVREAAQ